MAASKSSPRDRRVSTDPRRGAKPSAGRPEADAGKKKKRSPLRKITAKPVKAPRNVPVGPKQIRHLRGLGHALNPVVHVGKAGITAELVASARAQLAAHELIKVKVSEEDRDVRQEMAAELAKATGAVLAQVLGRTVLLYKRSAKNPKIVLPAGGDAPANAAPATAVDADESDDDDDDGVDDEPEEDSADDDDASDDDDDDDASDDDESDDDDDADDDDDDESDDDEAATDDEEF